MNKRLFISSIILALLLMNNSALAATISQCTQPDGTIEFTNKGCSKSNILYSRKTYSRNSSQSLITRGKTIHTRNRSPFMRSDFVQLQKKLLHAETLSEIEQHAQAITDKVRMHAQLDNLKTAYDMIAATYVKLSKDMKKKQWEGQSINHTTLEIRTLFEEIMITQSTISTANELNQAIKAAWKKYQEHT